MVSKNNLKSSFQLKELFSYKYFCIFWICRVIGITAYQILIVALAWQLYDLTSNPLDLGLIGLFQFLPVLILSLPAGQIVDRFHKGKILGLCFFLQSIVALWLSYSSFHELISRNSFFIVAIILGFVRTFQMPTQQSLTPSLVPRHLLQNAIAFSSSGMHTAIIVGPAIGGFLYVLGPDVVYMICTSLLIFSFLLTFLVKYKHKENIEKISLNNLLAGVRFILNNKTLLGAISLDLFAVLLGGATALLPVFAKDILDVGPEGLGFLKASPAAGALLCALLMTKWPIKEKAGQKLFISVAIFGMAMLVFGLSTSFFLSIIALVVSGAADSLSVVIRMTLIQLETPDNMRGRVSSVNAIFIGASNELGEFESGVTASLFGAVNSILLGSIGTIVIVFAWAKFFPTLLKRDKL